MKTRKYSLFVLALDNKNQKHKYFFNFNNILFLRLKIIIKAFYVKGVII
jgi:hypothetical protein